VSIINAEVIPLGLNKKNKFSDGRGGSKRRAGGESKKKNSLRKLEPLNKALRPRGKGDNRVNLLGGGRNKASNAPEGEMYGSKNQRWEGNSPKGRVTGGRAAEGRKKRGEEFGLPFPQKEGIGWGAIFFRTGRNRRQNMWDRKGDPITKGKKQPCIENGRKNIKDLL